ncbi:MAG: hypothetical protein ACRCYE_13695 [Sarcina sp.]
MIIIDNFVFDTLKKLDEIEIGNCLDIRSYKKNRKVIIEKLENAFNLFEDGYRKEEFLNLTKDELKKLLKIIEKIEFPRSNRLRFYVLDSKDGSVCRANYREEIEIIEEEELINVIIESSYSKYMPIKNIIEEHNCIINEIDFLHYVIIKASLTDEVNEILKEYIKNILDVRMYSC